MFRNVLKGFIQFMMKEYVQNHVKKQIIVIKCVNQNVKPALDTLMLLHKIVLVVKKMTPTFTQKKIDLVYYQIAFLENMHISKMMRSFVESAVMNVRNVLDLKIINAQNVKIVSI